MPTPQTRALGRGRRTRWSARRAAPYLFLSPLGVLFGVFFVYPLLRSLWLSLHRPDAGGGYRFAGIDNYAFLLRDKLFWVASANTLFYAAAFVLLQVPLSLGLALLLDRRALRGRAVLRLAFFSPYLVGGVFAAVMFTLMLAPRYGLINRALARLPGVGSDLAWRSDAWLARPAIIIAGLWLTVGFGMIYCLAALQTVDPDLRDAAALDGAGPLARFRHVTLPALRPVLVFLILAASIGALQLFELPYVFFDGPGPRLAGLTVVMYLFQAGFDAGDLAYASAVGWALAGLIGVVSLLQWWVLRERA